MNIAIESINLVFTALCKIYVERRKSGVDRLQARSFPSCTWQTMQPFSTIDPDDLHNALYALSQRKAVYYTLDGSCELVEETANYLDKEFDLT